LQPGDSLRESVEDGIEHSDYAAVILTPAFLAGTWAEKEVEALVNSESKTGKPRILPVWFSVKLEQVRAFSPPLADRLAVDSSQGVEEVARELARMIGGRAEPSKARVRSMLLLPFSEDFAKPRRAVSEALNKAGVDVIKLPETPSGGALWVERFREAMRDADFVIADLTQANPNMFYELGIAEAFHKPVVLLQDSRDRTRLPSNLAGYSWILYDPGDLDDLTHSVGNVARRYMDTLTRQ
jgi:hypothetical protein